MFNRSQNNFAYGKKRRCMAECEEKRGRGLNDTNNHSLVKRYQDL